MRLLLIFIVTISTNLYATDIPKPSQSAIDAFIAARTYEKNLEHQATVIHKSTLIGLSEYEYYFKPEDNILEIKRYLINGEKNLEEQQTFFDEFLNSELEEYTEPDFSELTHLSSAEGVDIYEVNVRFYKRPGKERKKISKKFSGKLHYDRNIDQFFKYEETSTDSFKMYVVAKLNRVHVVENFSLNNDLLRLDNYKYFMDMKVMGIKDVSTIEGQVTYP